MEIRPTSSSQTNTEDYLPPQVRSLWVGGLPVVRPGESFSIASSIGAFHQGVFKTYQRERPSFSAFSLARITAVKPANSGIASSLPKAIDAGLISWNGQKPEFPPPVKLRGHGKLVSEIVMEDRG
jgi:hypothetical protein